jgi:hypothetical protein
MKGRQVGDTMGIADQARHLGDDSGSRDTWIAEKHELFDKPIPCRGHLKLFQVAADVVMQLPPRYSFLAHV